jgi:hypothetical protein
MGCGGEECGGVEKWRYMGYGMRIGVDKGGLGLWGVDKKQVLYVYDRVRIQVRG